VVVARNVIASQLAQASDPAESRSGEAALR
jgi:hypothetical protein